jgi:GT2 family glycosyltransferase
MTWGPNLVPLPGMMFRLSSLNQIGGFDENNKYSMDLDVLLRMRKIGKIINTKRTLASFRWHAESTTVSSRGKSLKEAAAVKRKYLPKYLRPFAPLWEVPVGIATRLAARRVSALARKKQEQSPVS